MNMLEVQAGKVFTTVKTSTLIIYMTARRQDDDRGQGKLRVIPGPRTKKKRREEDAITRRFRQKIKATSRRRDFLSWPGTRT